MQVMAMWLWIALFTLPFMYRACRHALDALVEETLLFVAEVVRGGGIPKPSESPCHTTVKAIMLKLLQRTARVTSSPFALTYYANSVSERSGKPTWEVRRHWQANLRRIRLHWKDTANGGF